MAITSRQIIDFLLANPSMSDADIVAAMEQYGVSPAQMAEAVGLKEGEVAARVAATVPPGQSVTLGDTIVQPKYTTTGSGEDEQVGGIENVITYKTVDNKVGGDVTFTRLLVKFQQTTKQQEVNATKDFLKFAAITGAGLYGLSALGAGAGTTGLTLAELGGTAGAGALTAAETAALYGTAGTGLLGGGSLTAGLTVADIAALEAGLPSGVGSLTAGLTAAQIAAGEAALPTAGGSLTTGLTAAQIAAAEAGLPTTTGLLSSTIPRSSGNGSLRQQRLQLRLRH